MGYQAVLACFVFYFRPISQIPEDGIPVHKANIYYRNLAYSVMHSSNRGQQIVSVKVQIINVLGSVSCKASV